MKSRANSILSKSASRNFELLCISLLIEAYKSALSANQYDIEWKENSFTSYLVAFIHSNPTTYRNKLFVKVQVEPENNNLPVENSINDPDFQPCIDMWFGNWHNIRNEFYIEAKLLSSHSWKKKNGKTVSASKYRNRYIDTGIGNFISSRYPKGCLVAYIINGTAVNCIEDINALLKKRKREQEILFLKPLIEDFNNSYTSNHSFGKSNIELKHIFLEFQRN